MATITTKVETGRFAGTGVFVDGELIAHITEATGQGPIDRFVALAKQHHEELGRLVAAAAAKRQWNMSNRGKGRDWPEFRAVDRMKNRLCKEAGIVDT